MTAEKSHRQMQDEWALAYIASRSTRRGSTSTTTNTNSTTKEN